MAWIYIYINRFLLLVVYVAHVNPFYE